MNGINLLSQHATSKGNNMNQPVISKKTRTCSSFLELIQSRNEQAAPSVSNQDIQTRELDRSHVSIIHLQHQKISERDKAEELSENEFKMIDFDLLNEDISALLGVISPEQAESKNYPSTTYQSLLALLKVEEEQLAAADFIEEIRSRGISADEMQSVMTQFNQLNELVEQVQQVNPELSQLLSSLTEIIGESEGSLRYDEQKTADARQVISSMFPDLYELATDLTETLSSKENLGELDFKALTLLRELSMNANPSNSDRLVEKSNNSLESHFTDLLMQIKSILNSMVEQQELIKSSPKLLDLLNQWTALEESHGSNRIIQLLSTETDDTELILWKDVLSSFQKRSDFVKANRYHSEAEVTSKDIVKWVRRGIDSSVNMGREIDVKQPIIAAPMSRLEQYVVHINQADQTEAPDKQLVNQFNNIIKTGRFTMNNGVNQFTIGIRPDNLGEMVVRLTEMNGEMALKILVSSDTTKQMLEKNIKELRNLFSPHQVVIEKQESGLNQIQKEHQDQSLDDHEENQSNHSNQEETNDSGETFEKEFKELLMNLKV